ncbi:MAG: AgmX/PglI C-terminal domain-containing protein [Deltaproteobacteria bacterium]|jgi:outer membrane biosynthesis protein TonB|nr:AgmX/PglI C-terminal domain-containing protein [Deltaproteobacteria bacterium]
MKQRVIHFFTIFILFLFTFSCQKKSEEKQKSKSQETIEQTEPEVEETEDTGQQKSKVAKPESNSEKKDKTVTVTDKLDVDKKIFADEAGTGSAESAVATKQTPSPLKKEKKRFIGTDQKSPVALSSSITTFSVINPRQIRKFMNKKNEECRLCYYKEDEAEQRVPETVEITFTFKPGGKISSCQINKPLQNKKTGKCICKKAEQWNFPNLKKEISFKHKFKFTP